MVLLLDFEAEPTNIALCAIVEPTVVENELHVVHEVLNARIFVFLQLLANRLKVHGILYNVGVVGDAQLLPIDRVCENVSLLISLQSCQ